MAKYAFMGAFIYMLRCPDQSLYVGIATGTDLTKRVAEHNAGTYRGYTFTRRPGSFGPNISRSSQTPLRSNGKSKAGVGRKKKLSRVAIGTASPCWPSAGPDVH